MNDFVALRITNDVFCNTRQAAPGIYWERTNICSFPWIFSGSSLPTRTREFQATSCDSWLTPEFLLLNRFLVGIARRTWSVVWAAWGAHTSSFVHLLENVFAFVLILYERRCAIVSLQQGRYPEHHAVHRSASSCPVVSFTVLLQCSVYMCFCNARLTRGPLFVSMCIEWNFVSRKPPPPECWLLHLFYT